MIVVVGAGPAGIAAALRAAAHGAEVTVLDDNSGPGGQIWRGGYQFNETRISFVPNARVVWGDANRRTLVVETPKSQFEIGYDQLILATGARELFLPFPGWTLPGVAGVGGLQALVKGGLPVRRKRIAVGGSGPLLLAGAAFLRKAGADVVLIAEQASMGAVARFAGSLVSHPAKLMQASLLQASLAGIPYRFACRVERAEGNGRVEKVWFRSNDRAFAEEVDYAAVAWGLRPNTELAEMLGCQVNRAVEVDELQRTSVPSIYCAGEATGIGGVDLSQVEGELAGCAAVGEDGLARAMFKARAKARRFAKSIEHAFALSSSLRKLPDPDTIVCRCEDVRFGQLRHAQSFPEAKLHTRFGMGACQGRICGAAADFLFGWEPGYVRPPILPARTETLICSSANPG